MRIITITTFLVIFSSCLHEEAMSADQIYEQNRNEFINDYRKVFDPRSRINLLHISDPHIGSEDSEMNLDHAIKLSLEQDLNLSVIICTGDLSIGYDSKTNKEKVFRQFNINANKFFKSNIPTLVQLGNHDANDHDGEISASTSKQEQWSRVFQGISSKWTKIQWGDKEEYRHYHYYDLDNSIGSIRIIVLDQLDHSSPVDKSNGKLIYRCQEHAVYSQKQIDWLCNYALKTKPNTGIIIANHYPFMEKGNKEESLLINGEFVQDWRLIPDIIEAWSNRTTLKKTYYDKKGQQNISVNTDFTTYPKDSEFITYLVGHVHHKTFGVVKNYNQIFLMETTLGQGRGAFSSVERVKMSPSSSAFSALSIDRKEKKIYRTSFGAYIQTDNKHNSRIEIIDYKIK